MSELKPRPPALVVIVIYKFFTSGLLTFIAIGLLVISKKYDYLFTFAEEYMNTGKRHIIEQGLTEVLNISTTKMQLGALVAFIYAVVTAIEAIGLWHQKAWATILVVGIVGLTIPIEIYEIFHQASIIKAGVFIINVAMFVYLLRQALEEQKKHQIKVNSE